MKKFPLLHPASPESPPLFRYSAATLFSIDSELVLGVQLVELANAGDEIASTWIKRLEKTGGSNAFMEHIASVAGSLNAVLTPVFHAKAFQLQYSYAEIEPKERLYAWALIRIAHANLLDRIRWCDFKDCGKLFFAEDPRTRWCSARCGSTSRVRKKRKKDKQ